VHDSSPTVTTTPTADADRKPQPFNWRWSLVAGYLVTVFVASSRSTIPAFAARYSDKVLHAAAYAVLAVLLIWARTRGRLGSAGWRDGVFAVLGCVVYGATDEFHQWFVPGRQADVYDLLADFVGALIAVGAIGAWGIISRGSRLRHGA
jgi:VanZ family protein